MIIDIYNQTRSCNFALINFNEILNIMEENEATNQRIQEIKRHSLYRHPPPRQSTSDVSSVGGSEVGCIERQFSVNTAARLSVFSTKWRDFARTGGRETKKGTDYVLVTNIPNINNYELDDEFKDKRWKRRIFRSNLRKSGLQVTTKKIGGTDIVFDLILAGDKVLQKYAEMLRLKMPLKKDEKDIQNEAFKDMLEIEKTNRQNIFTETVKILLKFPLIKRTCRKMKRIFSPEKILTLKDVFWATYTRDEHKLFDSDHQSFFSELHKINIVEFVLNRQRFCEERDENGDYVDDFAFGIRDLLNTEVYTDAYPIHDGTLYEEGNFT